VDVGLLLAFVVAVFLLSLAPGPDMMFIVANAVVGGRRTGVVAALGMSTGLAVHTVAAAFGLGALVQAAPVVLDALRVTGALFLLYLAITSWRSARERTALDGTSVPKRSTTRVYVLAVLTNLANPKVVLFYLAFFPQFLTTGTGSWPATEQFLLLGAVFIVVGLAVDASAGLLAGTLSERVLHRPSVRRWMARVAAAIFGGLAARLALDAN
jgi:threonine/homoserine/homoserine lactone efflux protein